MKLGSHKHILWALVSDSILKTAEIATESFKIYKLTVFDQSLAELIQAGNKTLHSGIHKFI